MRYEDYLRSAAWQRQRAQALERAEYCCALCASAIRLNVHHRTYARLGDERPADLTVLCRDCHARFHNKLPVAPKESRFTRLRRIAAAVEADLSRQEEEMTRQEIDRRRRGFGLHIPLLQEMRDEERRELEALMC